MKSVDDENMDIEEIIKSVDIDVMEDGNKVIRIVSKKGPTPDENGAFLGVLIDSDEGVLKIDGTVEGSPAQKAGLQKGDGIHLINGNKIQSYEKLIEILSQFKPGETIEILYSRDQKYNKVQATLVRRGDVVGTEKMIWKTEDGEEIEINEAKEMHFHGKDKDGKDKDGKVKKEKIIIKKKIKKEKE